MANSVRQSLQIVKTLTPSISMKYWGKQILGDTRTISLRQLTQQSKVDSDADSLPDFWEHFLAEKFAPIIYHSSDESNFPTNVDWFLSKTELRFYDDKCTPDLDKLIVRAPTQMQLLCQRYTAEMLNIKKTL